jgi:phosphate starvation-inducible PhoH-like protein
MSTPAAVEPAREFDLVPPDNARLANLCGPLDENLRLIEDRMGVSVKRRGASFRIAGRRAHAAEDLVRDLFDASNREEISLERVHLALRDSRDMPGALSPDEPADGGSVRVSRGTIRARGRNQRDYLANIRARDLSFGIGPAGTGKTYLAVACAVEALQADHVRRLVLVRPAVEAGERLGFLPGDLTQKVDPYLRPMYDALYEMLGFDRVARFIERNVIEVAPLAFMRGRSLNDSFIILDEAQNTTPEQMKMFLTRIGFGSKAVVTADMTQVDLPTGRSGMTSLQRVLGDIEGLEFVHLSSKDVVRHHIVQDIVDAYERAEVARASAGGGDPAP